MRDKQRRRPRLPIPKTPDAKTVFTIDTPPELPRLVQQSALAKWGPFVLVAVVVGMIAMFFVTGVRQINPIYMVFVAMMVFSAVGSFQNAGDGAQDTSTPKVNAERADYLRYLSIKRADIRDARDAQLAAARWSHPDPQHLHRFTDGQRLWERALNSPDWLHIRVGLHTVKLRYPIKPKDQPAEIDLEPVGLVALQHLRQVQQTIPHCPTAINFVSKGKLTVYGDRDLFRAAVRAWTAQLATWHRPDAVSLAVVSADLTVWDWAKWLPHSESVRDIDGAGAARRLVTSVPELQLKFLDPMLEGRDKADVTSKTIPPHHVVIVVDDPDVDEATLKGWAEYSGVTVIVFRRGAPDRDFNPAADPNNRDLTLKVAADTDGRPRLWTWQRFAWQPFCDEPDFLDVPQTEFLARQITRWDEPTSTRGSDQGDAATITHLALLGITNAAKLEIVTTDARSLHLPASAATDLVTPQHRAVPLGRLTADNKLEIPKLWLPRPRSEQLKVPIGLRPNGEPRWLDLKEEDEEGVGPHGLVIGMTGAGKSRLLQAILGGLFALNPPTVVQAILGDFKGEAGLDKYADFPHVLGFVSNLEDKVSKVDRFVETLLGLEDRRERQLKDAGMDIQGSAFESVRDYEAAIADGHDYLEPLPTIVVVLDEFSIMIDQHKEVVDVVDYIAKKGRSHRIHIMFASQMLEIGKYKTILDNVSYRICLRVASPAASNAVIGVPDAYHISGDKAFKGTGYFRQAGSEPDRYKGFMFPDKYKPPVVETTTVQYADPRPRLFSPGWVKPDPSTTITTRTEGETVISGQPKSFALTMCEQLKNYAPPPEDLWTEPLDQPIALDTITVQDTELSNGDGSGLRWPLGLIDEPRKLRYSTLMFDIDTCENLTITGGPGAGVEESMRTFIMSAAWHYKPERIGFYVTRYGGPQLLALEELPHVGAIADKDEPERIRRMFAELNALLDARKREFVACKVRSLQDYRRRRLEGDTTLDARYPIDIVVCVDKWGEFIKDNTSAFSNTNPFRDDVITFAGAGAYGIHVAVGGENWNLFPPALQGKLPEPGQFELRLANTTDSQVKMRVIRDKVVYKPAERVPFHQPGRGVTRSGEDIRFAVGRLDGQPTGDGLDAAITAAVTAIGARHNTAYRTPPVSTLPIFLPAAKMPVPAGELMPIGMRESDLQPYYHDFTTTPLLAIYGSESGKTTTLRRIIRTLHQGTNDESLMIVCDVRRGLIDENIGGHREGDHYLVSAESIARTMAALSVKLRKRTPPPDLPTAELKSWNPGPPIYVIIDDLDNAPDSTSITNGDGAVIPVSLFAPLVEHIDSARDLNLRVIVAHRTSDAFMYENSPRSVLGKISNSVGKARLILAGTTMQGGKIAGIKPDPSLNPGRAILVTDKDGEDGYVQLATDESWESVQDHARSRR